MNSTAIEWEAASGSSRSRGDVWNPKEDLTFALVLSFARPRENIESELKREIESAATWCSPLHPTA